MRKGLLGIPIVVAFVVAAFTGGAQAAPGEGGPPCADIVRETHSFPASTTGTYTLNMQVELAAPACIGKLSYQLFVVTDAGTSEATLTGFSPLGYPQYTFSSSDSTICVYATTSSKAGHTYDRAPNADSSPDCLALTAGPSGGGSGFG